jgi:hypothetical protein
LKKDSERSAVCVQEAIDMSFDDLLIALIIVGFGLSGAYFRAEYLSWRRGQASARKRESSLRDLHASRLSGERNDPPAARINRMEKILNAKIMSSEPITDGSSIQPFLSELQKLGSSR